MSWRVDAAIQPDGLIHCWPDGDATAHHLDGAGCVCGPALEEQLDGLILATHHSLDGRESTE